MTKWVSVVNVAMAVDGNTIIFRPFWSSCLHSKTLVSMLYTRKQTPEYKQDPIRLTHEDIKFYKGF
jgi:hypothetical protein